MHRLFTGMMTTAIMTILAMPASVHAQPEFSRDIMNGTWFVAEADEGFSVRLDITPESITLTSLEPTYQPAGHPSVVVQYLADQSSGALYVIQVPMGVYYWLFQSENQAILWMPNDDNVHFAVRQAGMPAELMGDWQVWTPEQVVTFTHVTLNADSVVMYGPEGEQTVAVFAVRTMGPWLELRLDSNPHMQPQWLHVQPLPDGSYMLWPNGNDDYIVLYREGAAPSWIPSGTQ